MGWRFYKRIRVAPGVSINLSKGIPSVSIGPRGFKYTISSKGTKTTMGLPGTGISYTDYKPFKKNQNAPAQTPVSKSPGNPLTQIQSTSSKTTKNISSAKLNASSQEEQCLADAIENFNNGECGKAEVLLLPYGSNADCCFFLGFLNLIKNNLAESEKRFMRSMSLKNDIGRTMGKIGVDFHVILKITEHVEAPVSFDNKGICLCLAEVLQRENRHNDAIRFLAELWNTNPTDEIVCLSLMELVLTSPSPNTDDLNEIVSISGTVDNIGAIHADILYLRAHALVRLNRVPEAEAISTDLINYSNGNYPVDLIHRILYLRANIYDKSNRFKEALNDYNMIYKQNPLFRDVASKIKKP